MMDTSDARPVVCVIDDDELVRQAVSTLLQGNGYRVIEAEDGEVGLAMIERHAPSLVITDIMMPKREGIETIRESKKRCSNVPVLVMSGSPVGGKADYLDIARKLGADDCIKKPFTAEALLKHVKALCSPSR
jgi:DNA-binding response OmpR family regulator